MNRVYQVYKGLQDAGRDILLPAPPLASYDGQEKGHVPNHGHGQIDRPDPHKGRKNFKTCLTVLLSSELEKKMLHFKCFTKIFVSNPEFQKILLRAF